MGTQGVIILQAQQSSLELIAWTCPVWSSSKQWPCTTFMPRRYFSHWEKGKDHVMTYLGRWENMVELRSTQIKSVLWVCIDQALAKVAKDDQTPNVCPICSIHRYGRAVIVSGVKIGCGFPQSRHQLQRKSNLDAQSKIKLPSWGGTTAQCVISSYQPYVKESTVEVMNIISDVVRQNARYAEAPTKSWDMDEEPINHGFCRASSNTARSSSNFLPHCDFFNFNKLSTKIGSLGSRSVHVTTLCTYRLQGFHSVGGVCLPEQVGQPGQVFFPCIWLVYPWILKIEICMQEYDMIHGASQAVRNTHISMRANFQPRRHPHFLLACWRQREAPSNFQSSFTPSLAPMHGQLRVISTRAVG